MPHRPHIGATVTPPWREPSSAIAGAREISPTTDRRGAGDPDAKGRASVSGTRTKVCVALAYKQLGAITGAHIHRGASNENGPVVVPLGTPKNGAIGASSSCHTVTPALSQSLVRTPGDFYVNIHTAQYPDGAIRGQLKRG